MKEKPILFSCEMVRAILDGRKTQTRRVITPQPYPSKVGDGLWGVKTKRSEKAMALINATPDDVVYWCKQWCPYGYAGDQLWVRETWGMILPESTGNQWYTIRNARPFQLHPESNPVDGIAGAIYRADGEFEFTTGWDKWKPSIFMPRWASRITLDVVNVRVEQVQDISEQDAYAEGIDRSPKMPHPRQWFRELWNSINAKRGYGWERNPWVWVITFSPIR